MQRRIPWTIAVLASVSVLVGCEQPPAGQRGSPPAPRAEGEPEPERSAPVDPDPRRGGGGATTGDGGVDAAGLGATEPETAPTAPSGSDRTPRVEIEELRVVGAIDASFVGELVAERLDDLESCYAGRDLDTPGPQGELEVRWRIVRTNRVTDVEVVRDTIGDGALARCARRTIRRWRLPSNCKGGFDRVSATFAVQPRRDALHSAPDGPSHAPAM